MLAKVLLCCLSLGAVVYQSNAADAASTKVVCYYDSSSFLREGLGKMVVADLEPAMRMCTHLVYGYAGIDAATNKVTSLNSNLDLDAGKGHYRTITQLKSKFPLVKILLSVGGTADKDTPEKYLTILETSGARMSFINSLYTLVKTYNFDGIDLAWDFPPNRPKKIRSSVGSFWHKVKKTFGGSSSPVDEKWEEHREEFTALVREVKNAIRHDGYIFSLTVNPNVNSSLFFDIPSLINNVDFVNLNAFDFQTPDRNPKEADFPAPLYELNERNPENNVNYVVKYWLDRTAPASKLNLGISTHARAWKLPTDATATGVPPIRDLEEPAPEGNQSKIPGLYSWPEVCALLPNPSNANLKGEFAPFKKIGDPTKRYGTLAYRLPDDDGNFGVWVGYEDPDTAGNKAGYVRAKGLGGVAIVDLAYDDFRGTCNGEKFPILRAAENRLK